ncbi:molybdate ABC transporter substrate-binding protein [Ideonella azotifigens]|uniref:Molybdate ABC transporter substrate-binding protein n=1 Tax=Ideonella azotifigens TaxID=513160 RepID=A0ABN1JIU2_9BURK|nr:molybdate ABC transporter substrate-binding protein [Ideonella azotifigens]MCD2342034.1 molybdate ABC transporter substrate-binding protein [Ideonella azotifigens]
MTFPWTLKPLRQGVFAALALLSLATHAAELTVSAAASLSNAFKDLAPSFEAQNPGTRLLFNFAASDALLAQIAKGAPVDVFASADQETMDKAEQQKLLAVGSRRNFAANSLVLITPLEGGLPLQSLADLGRSEVKRIALGKPEGVPAGRYAKGTLEAARLWPVVEPKAVYAQNVRQALDYVARGETEAGFVYATDAAVQKDKVKVVLTVPTETAISYPIAVIEGSANADAARKWLAHVLSPAGQAVLARHGFQKP